MQIAFSIQIDPRFTAKVKQGSELALSKATDAFLRDTAKDIQRIVQNNAPKRTGRLRAGIIINEKTKSGGGLDRRANLKIESTAPYSRYVVAGAKPSIGDGTPGTGKFFGPGGFGFRATKGYTGKTFRAGFGFWPGFKPNNFLRKSIQEISATYGEKLRFLSIASYTESYNKLGLRFG